MSKYIDSVSFLFLKVHLKTNKEFTLSVLETIAGKIYAQYLNYRCQKRKWLHSKNNENVFSYLRILVTQLYSKERRFRFLYFVCPLDIASAAAFLFSAEIRIWWKRTQKLYCVRTNTHTQRALFPLNWFSWHRNLRCLRVYR